MECVADHCASDVSVGGCEVSAFFYSWDRPKNNGEVRGLFISWRKVEKRVGNHYLRIMKKGPEFFLTPCISLVAGRGFEPLTFGL